ncbi:hypothetical protein GCM10007276_10580 [Agaricicola taiwanensis]|uniref:DUF3617 family protein n=1 Tax=Agaricicola taiwanensis TaxID=591372 RepID=A0A8J2VNK1_9RHOB|nr:hypothetical protein [Agaricicola taiwanensis]GGE34952.1 hypothetical protein GCM10007276_10580 [Agaricicola taiwanensis]
MQTHSLFAVFAAAAVSVAAIPLKAAEEDYINRFDGSWSGSGSAKRPQDDSPWNIRCSMSGNSAQRSITIDGSCRAAVIVSRPFAANIRYNPRTKLYTGTYTGARVGPAKVSGRRRGDAVVMTVTWPRPLHGDRKATLTIRNSGNGQMAITLMDNLRPGGPVEKTTDVRLRRG